MPRIFKTAAVFLAALLLLTPLFPAPAVAEEAINNQSGDYVYTVSADGTAVIARYNGEAETLSVPSFLDGYPVTAIGDIAFAGCESLTSVTLPEGLLSIGSNAFYACSSLTDIMLPEGLLRIDGYAFSDCKSLKDITLPLSLTEIGGNPFAMTTLNINLSPDHARFEILNGLLVDKAEKRLITYPYGSQASKYTVPDGILIIGDYAFYGSANLTAVTLPEGLLSLREGAFYGCENLTDITLPLSLTELEPNPFVLTPVNITLSSDHPRFEVIGGVLFDKEEKKLLVYPYGSETSVYVVPDGVLAIEDYAFYICVNLTAVTLPEGLLSLGKGAFFGCESLADVTIPEGLLSIGDNAFYGCGSLTAVTLPLSLAEMGFNPFELVPAVITLSPDHPRFELIDGVLFDKSEQKLITYPYREEESVYTVSDNVLAIGDWAFSSCKNLTAITLREGLLSIGTSAFYGCEGLTDVTLPEGLLSIGSDAFYTCENLTTLTIPASVTAIGAGAFLECPNLTLIVVQGSFADTWAQENDVPFTYAQVPQR